MRAKPPRVLPILSGLLLFALLLGAASLAYLASPAPGLEPEGSIIEVRPGEGAGLLAQRLEAEGRLRSALVFKLLARLEGREGSLRVGSYRLLPGTGAQGLLELLTEGRQILARLTLPEGLSLSEVGAEVEEAGLATRADFLAAARDPALLASLGIPAPSLEGYLFPDTYFIAQGSGAEALLRAMVANFRARISGLPGLEGLSPEALHDRVILASIVEREYRLPEEAPLMASVFMNRLRIGMALQSCATVVYVITERLGRPHPEVVYDRDLALDDPYNSYRQRGLPPGPIANPGLTALGAALDPPRTPWLYFRLVDPERGAHHFSSSFEEHLGAGLLVKRAAGK